MTPAPHRVKGGGAADVGAAGDGESGVGESGVGESGVGESGVGESGVGESGDSESGVGESGVGESGVGESGDSKSGAGIIVVMLNGACVDLPADACVADLVASHCSSPRGVAVARNGDVVPRSTWNREQLAAGDVVEIVTAAAGG